MRWKVTRTTDGNWLVTLGIVAYGSFREWPDALRFARWKATP